LPDALTKRNGLTQKPSEDAGAKTNIIFPAKGKSEAGQYTIGARVPRLTTDRHGQKEELMGFFFPGGRHEPTHYGSIPPSFILNENFVKAHTRSQPFVTGP